MLYKKSSEPGLSQELFKNPTAEYRGAPFWAWNCKLETTELLRQIEAFKEMGMGGFFMHSRAGLKTPYMGEEFMAIAKACHEEAIKKDMLCYLYDEDRWPSGAAGGLVTQDHSLRMQFLTLCPMDENYGDNTADTTNWPKAGSDSKKLLARYRICLANGFLSKYERLNLDSVPTDSENIWEAYQVATADSPWFNDQTYVNTLDKQSVDRFIEVTHEKYLSHMGDGFGKTIPGIFTDEPQFFGWQGLGRSQDKQFLIMPFTDDLEETYSKAYGQSLLDNLPEVFWELPDGKPSKTRYQCHDHVSERFTQAFSDNLGAWCEKNNIMLTGHMMSEQSLNSQTRLIGEAMRHYRAFQLPGIDLLCDNYEFSTAKQAQSAARQYGREGVLSELYGVTNWDFDFRGHKLQGDWQAALGITLRVHHLAWASMAGEGKRDYPASIGYQSPWYKEYGLIEDHFARVNTAMTRGKAVVRVAVIHPIESMWLHFGARDKTAAMREDMDKNFHQIIEWLLYGQIDFDFVAESLLPELHKETGGKFTVGEMAYDAVLIPGCYTLRSTTLAALQCFSKNGGTVVFAGEPAKVMDGSLSDKISNFAKECNIVPYTRSHVLSALAPFKDISMTLPDGTNASHIYQLRQDGNDLWLFTGNGVKPFPDTPIPVPVLVSIRGEYAPTLYDTLSGDIIPLAATYVGGQTLISRTIDLHDSLLIKLTPGRTKTPINDIPPTINNWIQLPAPHSFALSEPNVLVLDKAFHEDSTEAEDILRIDDIYRNKLGYPTRSETTQPWATPENPDNNSILNLRYVISSEIELDEIFLALETPDKTEIIWNGQAITTAPDGYYVDRDIKTVRLPKLAKGENSLHLKLQFSPHTPAEPAYLLGHFGVRVEGQRTTITSYPKSLSFGDITQMGLPFYGGNVTYKCTVQGSGKHMVLESTLFRCPLVRVKLDGKPIGSVAFAPYTLDLGVLAYGAHELEITAFGNRYNTFGAIHNVANTRWHGPNAWRTTGAEWSDAYVLKPMGILKSPRIGAYE